MYIILSKRVGKKTVWMKATFIFFNFILFLCDKHVSYITNHNKKKKEMGKEEG